jgi:hypothetical protein
MTTTPRRLSPQLCLPLQLRQAVMRLGTKHGHLVPEIGDELVPLLIRRTAGEGRRRIQVGKSRYRSTLHIQPQYIRYVSWIVRGWTRSTPIAISTTSKRT